MEEAIGFGGGGAFSDDLTVLVARLNEAVNAVEEA